MTKPLLVLLPGMGYAGLEALVRSQLPRDVPYILVGESFSGPVAASIAGAPPMGLRGTVLCCTFVRNPRPQFAVLRGLLGFVPLKSAPIAAMAPILFGRYATTALQIMLSAALAQVGNATLRARLMEVSQVDVRLRLAAAPGPVLYLQAMHDVLVPAHAATEVRACLPTVAIQRVAGPHLLLQANPVPAAAAIKRFVHQLFDTDSAPNTTAQPCPPS